MMLFPGAIGSEKSGNLILLRIAVIILLIFLTGCSEITRDDSSATQDFQIELKSGWQYRWGDSPLNNHDQPSWVFEPDNTQWKNLEQFPAQPPERQGSNNLWMSVLLPDKALKDPVLYTQGIFMSVDAYLDGKKIYSFGDIDKQGFSRFSGYKWHIIDLPEDSGGKYLFFRIYSDFYYIGFHRSVTLSSYRSFITDVLQTEADNVVLSFIFFFAGCFFVYIHFKKVASKAFLYFGLTLFCLFIYSFYYTYLKVIFFDYAYFSTYLWYLMIFMIPVTFIGTYHHIFDAGWKAIISKLFYTHLLLALLNVAAFSVDAVLYLAGSDFSLVNLLVYNRVVIVLLSLFSLGVLAVDSVIRADRKSVV